MIDAEDEQACEAEKYPAKKHDCNHVILREYFNHRHEQIGEWHSVLIVLMVQIRKGQ
jgi:hypothetical protein